MIFRCLINNLEWLPQDFVWQSLWWDPLPSQKCHNSSREEELASFVSVGEVWNLLFVVLHFFFPRIKQFFDISEKGHNYLMWQVSFLRFFTFRFNLHVSVYNCIYYFYSHIYTCIIIHLQFLTSYKQAHFIQIKKKKKSLTFKLKI